MVDFGLARWQSEWNINADDRVIGTSGYFFCPVYAIIKLSFVYILVLISSFCTGKTRYLAPEYLDAGNLTYKVDVYAFGIVLLELITGRRISEFEHNNGPSYLSEFFHPLLMVEPNHILEHLQILNPCLELESSQEFNLQLQAMARAASLCLRLDPDARPPMSKVCLSL